jgi:hypothetical protein
MDIIQYIFLTAASFLTAVLYVGASVCGSWTRVQRGTCHVGSYSDLFTVLLFCLYFLAILVCNFACDLCCFIVNVYSVKSSVELMLYCFIMCRIKIKFSYLILYDLVVLMKELKLQNFMLKYDSVREEIVAGP